MSAIGPEALRQNLTASDIITSTQSRLSTLSHTIASSGMNVIGGAAKNVLGVGLDILPAAAGIGLLIYGTRKLMSGLLGTTPPKLLG
ncbi:MAG: hypothetical protein V1926_04175 [Candidatus Peregrinibacteria bacterium]